MEACIANLACDIECGRTRAGKRVVKGWYLVIVAQVRANHNRPEALVLVSAQHKWLAGRLVQCYKQKGPGFWRYAQRK
jgi:hypothetical protein